MAGRTAIEGKEREGDQSLKISNRFEELFKILNIFKEPHQNILHRYLTKIALGSDK